MKTNSEELCRFVISEVASVRPDLPEAIKGVEFLPSGWVKIYTEQSISLEDAQLIRIAYQSIWLANVENTTCPVPAHLTDTTEL